MVMKIVIMAIVTKIRILSFLTEITVITTVTYEDGQLPLCLAPPSLVALFLLQVGSDFFHFQSYFHTFTNTFIPSGRE